MESVPNSCFPPDNPSHESVIQLLNTDTKTLAADLGDAASVLVFPREVTHAKRNNAVMVTTAMDARCL